MFCSFYFYLLLWGQYNSAAWGPRDQWLLVTGIRRTCNFDLLNRPPQFFGQFLSNYRKPKIVEKIEIKIESIWSRKSPFFTNILSPVGKSCPIRLFNFALPVHLFGPFKTLIDNPSLAEWFFIYPPTSASSHHMHAHTLLFYHLFLSSLSDLLAVLWLFHSLNKLSLSLSLNFSYILQILFTISLWNGGTIWLGLLHQRALEATKALRF